MEHSKVNEGKPLGHKSATRHIAHNVCELVFNYDEYSRSSDIGRVYRWLST